MGSAEVTVIVVHHDEPAACGRTTAAFLAQEGVAEVLVVDSSSRADSRRELRRLVAPEVGVLDAPGNVGFGPGANLGLRHWLERGDGEWVAVAPHDARPAAGCVARLLAAVADRPDAGLACAEFGADLPLVPVYDHVLGGYYRPARPGRGWQDVAYPHGTLLVARRALLEQVGLFDERYFAYCEEVDLALRARRAGWRIGLVWGAVVTNGHPPSRPVADYLQLRNTLLLVSDHETAKEVRARVLLAAAHHTLDVVRHPKAGLARARIARRAVSDFRQGRFGPPPAAVVRSVR